MSLLSLPVEVLHHVLSFLDWQSVICFLCTTHFICAHIVNRADVSRLRRVIGTRLEFSESLEREGRGWPLETNLQRSEDGRWIQNHLNGYSRVQDTLPCYVCLRKLPIRRFTVNMRSGPRALGQQQAKDRTCMGCGVRTGVYKDGMKMSYGCAVCIRCGHLMCPRKGWWRREEDLREIRPKQSNRDIDSELIFGDSAMMASVKRGFRWWNYSNACIECVLQDGWTAEELFAKKIRLCQKKERYVRDMIAYLDRSRETGRKIRTHLGIGEAQRKLPDVDALRTERDPFPKYQVKLGWVDRVPILEYAKSSKE